MKSEKIVWCIGGSDSSGAAGIQADLKTLTAFGVHACSVVSAVTAQNTAEVRGFEPVDADHFRMQIDALREDLAPSVVKVGMLGSLECIEALADELPRFSSARIICDPVLKSSSGTEFHSSRMLQGFVKRILPLSDLITPNLPEAEAILGRKIDSEEDVIHAAQRLLGFGARAVLIKGGHRDSDLAQDFFTDGKHSFWLTSDRHEGIDVRGTGCILASAISAGLALGYEVADAVVIGKSYVNRAIRLAHPLGKGRRLAHHESWPVQAQDLPRLTRSGEEARVIYRFADCGSDPLGFYPVVDRASWLERLLPLGVTTAQIRIKDLRGAELESELKRSIEIARGTGCRLFVNDYWELALRFGAYGVHLGQEDLETLSTEDLRRIESAGLRLGLSTHCFTEVARAHAVRPSYMAIGPIFPTTLKRMRFAPQGVEALRLWRSLLEYPLVAIGGISLERSRAILEAGADSIAVVSDVLANPDPEERTQEWLGIPRWGR